MPTLVKCIGVLTGKEKAECLTNAKKFMGEGFSAEEEVTGETKVKLGKFLDQEIKGFQESSEKLSPKKDTPKDKIIAKLIGKPKLQIEGTPDQPYTRKTVQQAFPGSNVTQRSDGSMVVRLPNGTTINVWEGNIQVTDSEGNKRAVRGAWIDRYRTMWLTSTAGTDTVFHESFHAAWAMALDRADKAALIKKYGTEEVAAKAYAKWKVKRLARNPIFQKIFDFFSTIRKAMYPGSPGAVFDRIHSGEVFKRHSALLSDIGPAAYALEHDDKKWEYDYDNVEFGTVNNRIANELNWMELMIGSSKRAISLPGKAVAKASERESLKKKGVKFRGDRRIVRSITAHDLGKDVDEALQSGRLAELMDEKISPIQLADKRELKGNERARFIRELKNLRNDTDYLSTNSKTGTSSNFILATCQPTSPCKHCYAARAMFRWSAIQKAWKDTIRILTNPTGWAERVSEEVNIKSKIEMPMVRMLGSGDLTFKEQVTAFNHLATLIDRPIHVFSRHHDNLEKLKSQPKSPFVKMGSIDAQLYETYGHKFLTENLKKRGIINAFLHTDASEYKAMDKLYKDKSLGLVLSASHKIHKQLANHNFGLSQGSCPCDADERSLYGSCIECAFSESGCFMAVADLGYDIDGKIWKASDMKAPKLYYFTEFIDRKPVDLMSKAEYEKAKGMKSLRKDKKRRMFDYEGATLGKARGYFTTFDQLVYKSIKNMQLRVDTYLKGFKAAAWKRYKKDHPNAVRKSVSRKISAIAKKDYKKWLKGGKKTPFPGEKKSIKLSSVIPDELESTDLVYSDEIINDDTVTIDTVEKAELYIEKLRAIGAKAKTGNFMLKGGPIQDPVYVKDWKILSKEEQAQQKLNAKITEQKIKSAESSRNQIPASFKRVDWKLGSTNIDIGGGKYDKATDYLKGKGVTNLVYDPFNRSEEFNYEIIRQLSMGPVDTATAANVLNVISEKAHRVNVVRQAAKAIKADGVAYFQIHEGDADGNGRVTKVKDGKDMVWQNHQPTKWYIDEVKEYFKTVKVANKTITATNPIKDNSMATWEVNGMPQYSITQVKEDPVILPPDLAELEEPFDLYSGTDLVEAIKYAQALELKLRAYDLATPKDDFVEYYRDETEEEFHGVADNSIELINGIYDHWLERHRGGEGWANQMFDIDGEQGIYNKPSEAFTNGVVGKMDTGSWSFDVEHEILQAVEAEHGMPEMPRTVEGVLKELDEEYGEDIDELKQQLEDGEIEDYNLDEMLHDRRVEDYQYADKMIYGGESGAELGEILDQQGWDSPIGDTILEELQLSGYEAWRANWGSVLKQTEDRIEAQRKKLDEAVTPAEKLSAITFALNEEHVYGTMSEHMDISDTELDELSNMGENIKDFSMLLRRNYRPGAIQYSLANPWDKEGWVVRTEGVSDKSFRQVDETIAVTRENFVYRGMTEAEFKNTVGKNKGVESRKDFSFGKEGTSFGEDFQTAESYVNYGRDDPRETGKPTYLVEVEKGENLKRNRQGYYEAEDAIPSSQISRVWKMEASGRDVVATPIQPQYGLASQEVIRSLKTADLLKHDRLKSAKIHKTPDNNLRVTFPNGRGFTIYQVNHITKDKAAFEAGYGEASMETGEAIAGEYWHEKESLKLSRYAGVYTIDHELMHFLERSGMLNRAEIAAINRELDKQGKDRTEEERAKWVEREMAKRDMERLEPKSMAERVLKSIKDFIDTMLNAFGKATPENVLRQMESGKIFERKATDKLSHEIQYSKLAEAWYSQMEQFLGGDKGLPGKSTPQAMLQVIDKFATPPVEITDEISRLDKIHQSHPNAFTKAELKKARKKAGKYKGHFKREELDWSGLRDELEEKARVKKWRSTKAGNQWIVQLDGSSDDLTGGKRYYMFDEEFGMQENKTPSFQTLEAAMHFAAEVSAERKGEKDAPRPDSAYVDFQQLPTDKITKKEILEYLSDNIMFVEEIIKYPSGHPKAKAGETLDEGEDSEYDIIWHDTVEVMGRPMTWGDTEAEGVIDWQRDLPALSWFADSDPDQLIADNPSKHFTEKDVEQLRFAQKLGEKRGRDKIEREFGEFAQPSWRTILQETQKILSKGAVYHAWLPSGTWEIKPSGEMFPNGRQPVELFHNGTVVEEYDSAEIAKVESQELTGEPFVRPVPEEVKDTRVKHNMTSRRLEGKSKGYREMVFRIPALTEKWELGFVEPVHYNETNIVVFVRFDERQLLDGSRVLYIDEIQSDLHQRGRKKGYKGVPMQKGFKATTMLPGGIELSGIGKTEEKAIESANLQLRAGGKDPIDAGKYTVVPNMVRNHQDHLSERESVPNAPHKKEWPLLAMKRMVRWAAENGYDKLAWSSAKIQNERWGLDKHIDQLYWERTKTTSKGRGEHYRYTIVGSKHDRQIVEKDNLTEDDLEAHVGKELTEKILAGVGSQPEGGPDMGSLDNLDLKVKGLGMIGFYDRMLPKMMKSFFGKKAWGKAEIEVVTLNERPPVNKKKYKRDTEVTIAIDDDGAPRMVTIPAYSTSLPGIVVTRFKDPLIQDGAVSLTITHQPSGLAIVPHGFNKTIAEAQEMVDRIGERTDVDWTVSEGELVAMITAKTLVGELLRNTVNEIKMAKTKGKKYAPEDVWAISINKTMRDKAKSEGMPQYATAQASAAVRGLTTKITNPISESEFFKQKMHDWVDKNLAIKEIQDFIGGVKERLNVFMQETQRPKVTAYRTEKFYDEMVTPIIEGAAKAKLKLSEIEELAHALHAEEANKALREAAALEQVNDIIDMPKTVGVTPAMKNGLRDELENVDRMGTGPAGNLRVLENFLVKHGDLVPELRDYWTVFRDEAAGMTDKEAKQIINKWQGNAKKAQIYDLVGKISDINDRKLGLLFMSGQINEEEFKAYSGKYKNYVPLYREGFEGEPISSAGRGLSAPGKPVKARGGSLRKVTDILANTIKNYEMAIIRSEKARSAEMLLGMVRENPKPGFWKVTKSKKAPYFDSMGNLRHYPTMKVGLNEMNVRVNGENFVIQVDRNNKTALRMIETLRGEGVQSGPLINALSKVNRYLSAINTMYAPEFILSNFFRDIQTGSINIKDSGLNTTAMLKKVGQSVRTIAGIESGKGNVSQAEQDLYRRYRQAGGKISWMDVHQTAESVAKKIEAEYQYAAGNRPARNTLRKWNKFWQSMNTSIENGARFAAFKLAIEAGKSDKEAAVIASDLTVDFTRKGAKGQVLNSLYLFANAGIQGSFRMFRALKNKRVRHAAGGIVMLGFTVGAWNALNGDDDDIEDYLKERNIVIRIPDSDKMIKIPLPWGFNVFFNMGDEAAKAVFKENYDPLNGAARMVSVMGNAFNPLQSGTVLQTLLPTIADPFAMVGENKNWFGGSLMPERNIFAKVPKPDSQRFFRSASSPSKWVAASLNSMTGGDEIERGGIDVSPETLDMVIDQVGGSAFRFISDLTLMPGRIKRDEVKVHTIPFLRRVAAEKSEYVDRKKYFKAREEINIAKEQLKLYPEMRREKAHILRLDSSLRQSEKMLRVLRKRLKGTQDREEERAILDRMNVVYQNFMIRYDRVAEGE